MHRERKDARIRHGGLRRLVAIVVVMAGVLAVPSSASAAGKLLVYDPDPGSANTVAVNEGYSQFAAAADRTQVTSTTLPTTDADWDQYACVVLPVIRAVNPPAGHPAVGVVEQSGFLPAVRSAFNGYMSRGGTVIAIAEHQNADPGQVVGPQSVTTMNNLGSTTGIQALNVSRNQGPTTTFDVEPDPWTKDVTKVGFAAATTLTVTAPARTLLRTVKTEVTDPPPAPFLAVRDIGPGKFVMSGDSNVFSDGGGGYYAGKDNAKLARNLCGDILPPVITITTPADGARYRNGQVLPAAWTCTDPDSGVDDLLTVATADVGDPVDTDSGGANTVTKTFTVTCTDNLGNTATKTHTYIVDGRPPVAAITTPADGATYNRNSFVPASWTCTDPDGAVDVASAVGTTAVDAAIDTVMPLGGAPIQKTYTVTCTDRAGNVGTATHTYTVADQNPPNATITRPLDGERFRIGEVVNADWFCTDPDGPQDIDTNATFGTTPDDSPVDTTGTVGQTIAKSITVVCVDLAGNTTSKTHTYYVDGNPPIVTINVPADGGTYPRGSTQPANWGCTDPDGDSDVVSKVGTLPVGTPINTGTLGQKTFKVTCTDQAGNISEKIVTYTVIGGPPDITITTPAQGATYEQGAVVSPSYVCTDADNDLKSCVREDGKTGPVDTSKPGTFTFKVNAEDVPGNTATKSVTYTVKAKGTVGASGGASPSTPAAKACTSRRQFRIRVKKLKGGVTAKSATVFVNGKKTVTRKGKRITAIVTLKGLKKGTYNVRISVRYSNGRVLTYNRKFRTCVPKGR